MKLCMHQEKDPTIVSQLMARIRKFQNRLSSLSDVKEFYDPQSGSSSGATHVPDRTSTVPSPRTFPRCDSGLPRDTQNGKGVTGNVFERPPAQERLSCTILTNQRSWHHPLMSSDLMVSNRQRMNEE